MLINVTKPKQDGYSLIETVVALALLSIVITATAKVEAGILAQLNANIRAFEDFKAETSWDSAALASPDCSTIEGIKGKIFLKCTKESSALSTLFLIN